MATRKRFYTRLDKRRTDAKLRQAEWAKLTDKQKFDALVKRGHGHCKQATKLQAL